MSQEGRGGADAGVGIGVGWGGVGGKYTAKSGGAGRVGWEGSIMPRRWSDTESFD